ncbi:hypothetical protein [Nitrosospira sp. Nsp13]|uniref:hypothetical protein n=1 Tax=Nitrosospira sp. Nsp13 TaxID=1855332 RepID=UPI000891971B|nr:hypothetical protein [Nitrosospira sp. Nsp13]SCY58060.1 hypothetical protein SAMN05216308_12017 [Nitrosospira sp. Nsp13]
MENPESTATSISGKAVSSMKNDSWQILRRAVVSGTMGGYEAAIAAALAGKCENDSFAAPLNAISHIIWGDEAARENRFSFKFTFMGLVLNHAAGIFWALFYEKLFGQCAANERKDISLLTDNNNGSLTKPLLGAATVAAGAYVVDYQLIPRRFTPGFEKRVSGKSLAAIFTALALGLAARDIIVARGNRQKSDPSRRPNHKALTHVTS